MNKIKQVINGYRSAVNDALNRNNYILLKNIRRKIIKHKYYNSNKKEFDKIISLIDTNINNSSNNNITFDDIFNNRFNLGWLEKYKGRLSDKLDDKIRYYIKGCLKGKEILGLVKDYYNRLWKDDPDVYDLNNLLKEVNNDINLKDKSPNAYNKLVLSIEDKIKYLNNRPDNKFINSININKEINKPNVNVTDTKFNVYNLIDYLNKLDINYKLNYKLTDKFYLDILVGEVGIRIIPDTNNYISSNIDYLNALNKLCKDEEIKLVYLHEEEFNKQYDKLDYITKLINK